MIQLELGPHECLPGQVLAGVVRWSELVGDLDIRLLWHSQSPLGRQVVTVAQERIPHPGSSGSRALSWNLPAGPYSFLSQHSQLDWAVEALAGKEFVTWPFVMGPMARPMDLVAEGD